MNIVILTQYYPPEIGAPQNRLSALALALKTSGHSVTVLTAMPNYPQGRLYPGYGGLLRREQRDGIELIRTFIYPTQSPHILKRLSCYFSFAGSSILLGGRFVREPDYVLTESPPLFLGIAGYLLSRWKRARWIFNVSDLWPESAVRLGLLKSGLALRVSESLEAFCYRRAWLVTGQSSGILQSVKERFPGVPTYHVSNGVDTTLFHPDRATPGARALLGSSSSCVVLYAGLHGLAQGLEQIVEAAGHLRNEPGIRFVFLGDGPTKRWLVELAAKRKLTNLFFLDPVPHKNVPQVIAVADILVIPLKTSLPGAVPSKLYEAMSSGRPVVVVASGEPAEIVSKHDAGVVVQPGDVEKLVLALRSLASDPSKRKRMGEAARQAALAYYDQLLITKQFVKYLEERL
jgi:glycosyltransferase involved in cell wall biosynthesis